MITFVVSGHASAPHPAERATITVVVSFTGSDRKAVRSQALSAHAAVVADAKSHDESKAATAWFADSVAVEAYHEWEKETAAATLRYRARSRVGVTFTDFDALADWVSDLAERTGIEFDGIDWKLTEPTRLRVQREVRVASVHDAITKAHDYAAGLGLGSPLLEKVFEAGLRPGVSGDASGGWVAQSRETRGAALELKPADIEVAASITADFTM
jgi:uncharacterized protein YggE